MWQNYMFGLWARGHPSGAQLWKARQRRASQQEEAGQEPTRDKEGAQVAPVFKQPLAGEIQTGWGRSLSAVR
eukprot:8536332-Pyramimonas_sp.AAC.1